MRLYFELGIETFSDLLKWKRFVNQYLDAAIEAARRAGQVLLDHQNKFSMREKAPRDLVTSADLAAQHAIEQFLQNRFPEHAFMGEESTPELRQAAIDSGKLLWVVDPLDGTANYVHGLSMYAVSIALVQGEDVLVGAVYDPVGDSMYTASADGPAMCNNQPIQRSACTSLEYAMIAASFPAGVKRDDPEVEQFLKVLENCQSIRRLGSAALNLCLVAQGRLDAYWASNVQTWDIAAGVLIAKRAGACCQSVSGARFDLWRPQPLVTATPELLEAMLDCIHA